MAVFKGKSLNANTVQELSDRSWLSSNLSAADDRAYNPNVVSLDAPTAGTYRRVPISPLLHSYGGAVVPSSQSEFYKGLHYTIGETVRDGSNYQIGVVANDLIIPVGVQVMSESKETIESISVTANQGVSISGILAGDVFNPYEEEELTLSVDGAGIASFNATIAITIVGDSNTYYVNIVGTRGVISNFRPQREMVEFIQFLTDVIVARNGEEQRRALRLYPRHSLQTQYIEPDKNKVNELKHSIIGKPSFRLGNGFWNMSRDVTIQPSVGDTTIYLDTTQAIYEEGKSLIVYDRSTDNYEISLINTINSDSIELTTEIANNYSDAVVAPYYFMQPSTPIKWNEFTNHTVFDLECAMADVVDVDAYTFTETYNGVGVWPYSCNLFENDSNEESVVNSYDEFDSNSGIFEKLGRWDSAKKVFKFGIHAKNRDECWKLRELIYYLRGRQKPVWISSMERDLIPTEDFEGQIIECAGTSFSDNLYQDGTVFNHVAIYENGESSIYAEITDASSNGDYQSVTFDTSFDLTDKDDVKISMLTLCRLNSDVVEIEWMSNSECYCALEFITIKE